MEKKVVYINPSYTNNIALQSFLNSLAEYFESNGTVLYGKRNLIKSFTIHDSSGQLREIVVKRFKYPNIIQRISYSFFRSSKAKRAFYNAAELRKREINTPIEIAYIEQWRNGLFTYGYYISAADYALPIREKLIVPEIFDTVMAEDFAGFAVTLHQKGILHHDLNSTNVLYHCKQGKRYSFSVIDINRMTFFPAGELPSYRECFENLTRFTGRMDLFTYVLKCYIMKRGWNTENYLAEAIRIKQKHDEQWRKRKKILRKFKRKNN